MLFVVNELPFSEENRPIAIALVASIVLHLVFFSVIHLPQQITKSDRVVVSVIELKPKTQIETVTPPEQLKQIVSPSPNEETPLEDTRLLSEHDSRAAAEQIKRGDGAVSTPAKSSPPTPKNTSVSPPDKPAAQTSSVPELVLKDKTLLERFAKNDEQSAASLSAPSALERELSGSKYTQSDSERLHKFQSYEPFSNQSLKNLFIGRPGNADYLPNIPDGDITLLNAKADRYAVFVRRVAVQVFGALRRKSWDHLPFGEVRQIRDFATAEATLSPDGKLLTVVVRESSGSASFDKIVVGATNEGAWDQNPPPGARASDGNYHFVFKARTWARGVPNGPGEQRWLLLGTGLL